MFPFASACRLHLAIVSETLMMLVAALTLMIEVYGRIC